MPDPAPGKHNIATTPAANIRFTPTLSAYWEDDEPDLAAEMIAANRNGFIVVTLDAGATGSPYERAMSFDFHVKVTAWARNAGKDFQWSKSATERATLCAKNPVAVVRIPVAAGELPAFDPDTPTLYDLSVAVGATDVCGERLPLEGYAIGGPLAVYQPTLGDTRAPA